MTTGLHADQTGLEVHTPYRQVFADAAARTGDATVYVAADINKIALQVDTNTQYRLSSIGPTVWTEFAKTYRFGHTYAIVGEVKVPAGDTDFIVPFFVSLVAGQLGFLVKARYKLNSGTSVTCKLQINDGDATGFTGITVTTTAGQTDPANVALADNDKIALVVTGVAGTPTHLSFTIFIEMTQ